MHELPIPALATSDPDAFEVLRFWMAQNTDCLSAQIEGYGDAEVWGITLAGIGRDVARLLAKQEGKPAEELLDEIEAAFHVELKAQSPRV